MRKYCVLTEWLLLEFHFKSMQKSLTQCVTLDKTLASISVHAVTVCLPVLNITKVLEPQNILLLIQKSTVWFKRVL